jgi:hypothetical protein
MAYVAAYAAVTTLGKSLEIDGIAPSQALMMDKAF